MKRRPQGLSLDEVAQWCLDQAEPVGECLVWPGYCHQRGYGVVKYKGGPVFVHRIVLRHYAGDAPADKPFAIHSCHNPPCINPQHLRWGSHQDNMDDMVAAGRQSRFSLRGEAKPGHKLTDNDVRAIRLLVADHSQREVAEKFGITGAMVSYIVSGQRRSDVE